MEMTVDIIEKLMKLMCANSIDRLEINGITIHKSRHAVAETIGKNHVDAFTDEDLLFYSSNP